MHMPLALHGEKLPQQNLLHQKLGVKRKRQLTLTIKTMTVVFSLRVTASMKSMVVMVLKIAAQ